MGVNRIGCSGEVVPLILRQRDLSVVDDQLVVFLTLLGATITSEHPVGEDKAFRLQHGAMGGGTELQRGAGFVASLAILPRAEVRGRLTELIETGLRECLRLVIIRGGHVVHDINHWKPPWWRSQG